MPREWSARVSSASASSTKGSNSVLAVGRAAIGKTHDKLRELVHADLYNLEPMSAELRGYDACFFCLGVSSAGMKEAEYRRITYDLTVSAAQLLSRLNPGFGLHLCVGRRHR